MTVSKTSISSLVVVAVVFLSMAFSVNAGGGGTPQIDMVAKACETVSSNFRKVQFTKEFCMTALKSDQNKSSEAKGYRHLALVSAGVLRSVVISTMAKIEALLPGEKNDYKSELGLRMCRVEYSSTPRILQMCSHMIKDYNVNYDESVSSEELSSCVDRVKTANNKCKADIFLTSALRELEKENEKIAVQVNLTSALVYEMADGQ